MKSTNTPSQILYASSWCQQYINSNRVALTTTGIRPMVIYEAYRASTAFPMGMKTFFPLLSPYGCYKTKFGLLSHYIIVEQPTNL